MGAVGGGRAAAELEEIGRRGDLALAAEALVNLKREYARVSATLSDQSLGVSS